ncbi:replication initiation protein [Xenorhabdus khoisanae]|uniref:replication initiation protein n=1 Tax=Xenorhabdus khoisanae TaxID=880157 RepID=UPI00235929EA|nr:replication initiation protein [Xenorhabdus khoisanae]MDC9616089.1 replication initiation protein [Xenorhabdus khoisanae]
MSDKVAIKSNSLIEAGYKLTLQEQRFLLTCISKLKAFNIPAEEQKTMTVTASEFFCNFPEMGRENAERELNKAIDRLWDRTIFIKEEEVKREVRWLQERATYISGEGKIEITFADTVLPYLTMLQGSFTKILLRNVSSLTSSYSIRLYELLIQRFDFQTRYIPLDEFRAMLGLGSKYPQFRALNQWVIKPSVNELNEKTDLKVKVDTVKQGKKVVALHFQFKEDKQIKIPM